MIDFLLNWLPQVATFFLTICYIPQVIHTYKTKDVTGIKTSFYGYLNIALTALLVNAICILIKTHVWGPLVTEILNESLAFVMLCLVLKYRKK